MFYVLSKSGEVVENYNAPVEAYHSDSDAKAVERAQKIGADRIVTSDGRVVVIPAAAPAPQA